MSVRDITHTKRKNVERTDSENELKGYNDGENQNRPSSRSSWSSTESRSSKGLRKNNKVDFTQMVNYFTQKED